MSDIDVKKVDTSGEQKPKDKAGSPVVIEVKINGLLKPINADRQIATTLSTLYDKAQFPPTLKQKTLERITSNNWTFTLDPQAKNVTVEDVYAISMLAMMIDGMNIGIDLPDPYDYVKVLENVSLFRDDLATGEKAKLPKDASGAMNLTPAMQAAIISESVSMAKKISDKRNVVSSNNLAEEDPNSAIIKLLHDLKYKVSGTIKDEGNKLIVTDNKLRKSDIVNIINCFSGSRYYATFSISGFGGVLIPKLEALKKYLNDDEKKIIDKLIGELKSDRKEVKSKMEGITGEDKNALDNILLKLYSIKYSGELFELIKVYKFTLNNLKKIPGLSEENVIKLSWLTKHIGLNGVPGEITLGVTECNSDDEEKVAAFKAAMKVLNNEVACGIASIASKGTEENRSWWERITMETRAEALSPIKGTDQRKAVTTGAPQGYTLVLKYMLFNDDYVRELKTLSERLFDVKDKDGKLLKKGKLGKFDDFQNLVTKSNQMQQDLDSFTEACIKNGKIVMNPYTGVAEFSDDAAYRKYLEKQGEIQRFEDANRNNPVLAAFRNSDNTDLFMEMERYNYLVTYLTDDTIDYQFLTRFREKFPELVKEKFDITDPYGSTYDGTMVKRSVEELIYSKGGLYERSENGDKWSTLNIMVGEGGEEDKTVLAKQALAMAITTIALTKDRLDVGGSGLVVLSNLVPSAPIKAGVMLAAPILSSVGPVRGGATWKDVGKRGLLDKVAENLQLLTATRENFNYGLLWKTLVLEMIPDKGGELMKDFGDDAIQSMNMLDATNIEHIREYVKKMYEIINKDPELKKEIEKLIKAKKLKYPDLSEKNTGLAYLPLLESVLKDGMYIELQEEEVMPTGVFEYKDGKYVRVDLDKEKKKVVLEAADALRDLLLDIYALKSASVSVDQSKMKTPSMDPVGEVILGTAEGSAREVIIVDQRGRIAKQESVEKNYSPIDYFSKTLKTSLSFRFLIPYGQIPLGFYQTSKFGWDALKYLLEGKTEEAKSSLGMGTMMFRQTIISFFMWEHNPVYPMSGTIDKIRHGDYAGAAADFTVTAPFFGHALIKDYNLLTYGFRYMSGFTGMTFDEFLAKQGSVVRGSVKLARHVYDGGRWLGSKVAGKPYITRAEKIKHAKMTAEARRLARVAKRQAVIKSVADKVPKPVKSAANGMGKIKTAASRGIGKGGAKVKQLLGRTAGRSKMIRETVNVAREVTNVTANTGKLLYDNVLHGRIVDKTLSTVGKGGYDLVVEAVKNRSLKAGMLQAKETVGKIWANDAANLKAIKAGLTKPLGITVKTAAKASTVGKCMSVAGKVVIVATAAYEIASEFNENWNDLTSSDAKKVAVAQTKITIMAAGGFLVKGVTDLGGLAVGLFNKEAGRKVEASYDQIASAIANSPVYNIYKDVNRVTDKVLGSHSFLGKKIVNGLTEFSQSKVGAKIFHYLP